MDWRQPVAFKASSKRNGSTGGAVPGDSTRYASGVTVTTLAKTEATFGYRNTGILAGEYILRPSPDSGTCE
jgi:hypothetical protein